MRLDTGGLLRFSTMALVAAALGAGSGCGDELADGDGGVDPDAEGERDPAADADAGEQDADGDGDGARDADGDASDEAGGDGGADADAVSDGDADLPPAPDPWLEGPYGVAEPETVSVEIEGRSAVNVVVWRPADVTDAPFPAVVYSHGFQLNGRQYESTGRRLASHGVVALLPTYGDGLLSPRSHSELANDVIALLDWAVSASTTRGSPLEGLIDASRLGAGGHSRGGKQSILAAIRDDRIRATFDVDPVDSVPPGTAPGEANPSVTPELMGGLAVPSGYVGAGRAAGGVMACAPEAENYHQFFIASPAPSFEYLLPEAGHLDFPDRCGALCFTCTAGDDASWSRDFAIATMVAFYRVYLADDGRYRPWVDGAPVISLGERVVFTAR